jgi:hypothetical protein
VNSTLHQFYRWFMLIQSLMMKMKKTLISNDVLPIIGIVPILCLFFAQSVQALTLYNGWSYASDSFNDSTAGSPLQVGGTLYETYGMAFKQTDDTVYFAINSNLPVGGVPSAALDGYTRWGDLFLNFSGQDLNTASANGNLLAIRFDGQNESGVSSTGAYQNVVAKSVAPANYGFPTLASHTNAVINGGGNPTHGELSAFDPYFDQSQPLQNVMASGDKVGDINFLNLTDFSNLGLDFGYVGAIGSQTIGFSLDRSLLPDEGSFIAHLAAECANDISTIVGNLAPITPESVPEPSAILGLSLVGLLGGSRFRKRHVNQ